jgi:hypothetical protein
MGVSARVMGFDGHDADRFATGREKVAERMQAAFDVEEKRNRLQFIGRLQDIASVRTKCGD